MKKYIIIFAAIILLAVGGYFYIDHINKKESHDAENKSETRQISKNEPAQLQNISEEKKVEQIKETPKEDITQKIKQNVPFIVQAPFGNWKDPIFENGCEETAMIMAFEWTKGTLVISADEAQSEIKKLTAFENKTLGYNTDTDIYDMQKIFQKYFYKNQ